eukprot:2563743-Prymnesium_polylepis.1
MMFFGCSSRRITSITDVLRTVTDGRLGVSKCSGVYPVMRKCSLGLPAVDGRSRGRGGRPAR